MQQQEVLASPEPEAVAPRRRGRRGRRLLAVLLGLALFVLGPIAGFVFFLTTKLTDLTSDASLLPPSQTLGPDDSATPDERLIEAPGENYLLIGSDAQPGESGSRSDVIILGHVNAAKTKVYLIHFPRDLYVEIPGRGKDKINAAYAYGGGALLARTLQNLTSVKVDHAAKIDFEGFKSMTDAVGGVRVWAEEGRNDLNGEQALQFVRERYQLTEGDISRGRRQLAFVKALMVKSLSPEVVLNPIKLTKFITAVSDNVVVDEGMTASFMRSQALAMKGIRGGDIEFITAPFSGYGTALRNTPSVRRLIRAGSTGPKYSSRMPVGCVSSSSASPSATRQKPISVDDGRSREPSSLSSQLRACQRRNGRPSCSTTIS